MSSAPSEEQTPGNRRNRRRIWATTGLTLGAIAALGAAGAAWWAWIFVNERLSPWLTEVLTDSLDRPVALGEVERVSLTGIQFGPSAVPATVTDPDELYVESINVRFNLLQLLGRQLRPQINLNGVRAYVEQNERGDWVDVEIDLGGDDEGIEQDPLIEVSPTVGIQSSEIVLQPFQSETEQRLPLTIGNIEGSVTVANADVDDPLQVGSVVEAQVISLDLSAEPESAGNFAIDGEIQRLKYEDGTVDRGLDAVAANLSIQAQAADLAILTPTVFAFLPYNIPIQVAAGKVSGDLEATLIPREAPQWDGQADVTEGAIAVNGLPQLVNDINGRVLFRDNQLVFEDVEAEYGDLSATAEGTLDTRNGYDLSGQIAPFELANFIEDFGIPLPVDATGTFVAEEVTMTGALDDPNITGTIIATDVVTVDKVAFDSLIAELTYVREALIIGALDATPLDGGSLSGSGIYTLAKPAELSLQLTGSQLPADVIGQAYGLPDTVTLGAVDVDADISGAVNNLNGVVSWQAPAGDYPTSGTAEINASAVRVRDAVVAVAGGTVAGSGNLIQGQWDADLTAQGIQLGLFNDSLEGAIAAGDVRLSGSLDDLTLQGLQADGDVTAAIQGGSLNSQINLASGNWDADVQTRDFPVSRFVEGIPIAGASADARFAGTLDDLTLTGIRGDGTVSAAIAQGDVTSDFRLENGFWQLEGQGDNLQLGQLVADSQGTGSATFQLAGSLDNLSLAGIQGRANVLLSDGLATVASLSPQLARVRSPLDANVAWNGQVLQVNRLETAELTASGTITPLISGPSAPGIGAIDLAIAARDYTLAALPVSFPPLLDLGGQATFEGRLTGTPADLTLLGDLTLANLALNDLVFDPILMGDVRFASDEGLAVELLGQQDAIVVTYDLDPRQLDFRVQADDAIAIGQTEGNLLQTQVYNFPVSALNLPPAGVNPYGPLRGEVTFATATIDLQNFATVGQLDIADLGTGYFSVDRIFSGFTYNNGVVSVNNGEVRMSDRDSRGEVSTPRTYDLEGSYAFNQTPQLQATLSTEEGRLQDILDVMKISEIADFRRGFIPPDGFIPASQAEAESVLATTPAGDPNATLLNQLRRLAELVELDIQEDLRADTAPLPSLDELTGTFQGDVTLTATIPSDITVGFDIEGDNWTWGPDLSADAVTAKGRYQNGLIAFEPLRFEALEPETAAQSAYVDLNGAFSLDPDDTQRRAMQLTVVNLPADKLEGLANLPFELGGRLNGTATLRGRLANPDLAGDFQLVNGTLNRNPIDRADTSFTYAAGRLGLDANLLLVDSDDPLTLSAQVPYAPAFLATPPTDTSFALNANIRDEGFALLNLFTQQVSWEGGDGEAILQIEGVVYEPSGVRAFIPTRFDGLVLLQGATLGFDALPAPMTDVTGTIRLDPDRLAFVVDRLTGQFSEGSLVAQGTFPLRTPLANPIAVAAPESEPTDDAAPEEPTIPAVGLDDELESPPSSSERLEQTPLTLNLDNVALDLKGLYNGQVNGQVALGGSLETGTLLTGGLDLSDGVITIPEGSNSAVLVDDDRTSDRLPIGPFQFDDLRILFDRNVRVVEGAFLNVAARGGIRLDGTLANLNPRGTIRLPSGRIELFANSLRLAGNDDRAEFRGNFDPILDVTLQASIPDITSSSGIQPTTSPFPRNEVPDNQIENLGLTQQGNGLVRVTARYSGPASELSSLQTDLGNLELSSSPPRSTNELISLLSGNVLGAFSTLQDGDTALTGLATFAGSAILSRVRDFLGDTVPLSEFRVFQVTESSGQVNGSQDIGAEIGIDVRPNISVSVLKVLTNDTPFQFNTRYRISDQFTLRGTTSYEDFAERTGVSLEYETRF